jgi:hypothetical protein
MILPVVGAGRAELAVAGAFAATAGDAFGSATRDAAVTTALGAAGLTLAASV